MALLDVDQPANDFHSLILRVSETLDRNLRTFSVPKSRSSFLMKTLDKIEGKILRTDLIEYLLVSVHLEEIKQLLYVVFHQQFI